MVNHAVIHSRIKPQVHRKNIVIKTPKTVQVVVKPSISKTQSLNNIKQTTIKQRTQEQNPPTKNSAVIRPRNSAKRELRRKIPNIKYSTRNPTPESLEKIKKIQNKSRDRIMIVIGNGPSISEAPLEYLKNNQNIDILSINKPDERLWPTSHWAFFDRSQLRRHQAMWDSYNGIIFNSTAIKEQKAKSMQFKHLGKNGFSKDMLKGLHIGRSSVYASMQILLWMNYDHIYIFGCDMNPNGIDGKLHFYGVNPDVEPALRSQRFEKEAASYNYAAKYLSEADRLKFTFCTEYNPWPFVKEFNEMSHKSAIGPILEHANRLK